MTKYAIGVDFGTLSARALVVEIGTGRELHSATMNYPHAVMDEYLPDGTRLKPDWALQHPQDYLDCLAHVIPEAPVSYTHLDVYKRQSQALHP